MRPLQQPAILKKRNLVRQLSLRIQIQSAISDLIRCYEMTSGLAVVRLEIGNDNRNVTLDAVPGPSSAQWIH